MYVDPKEKAKQLVEKFEHFAMQHWHEDTGWNMESRKSNAKHCAIIACDEMIDWPVLGLDYWHDVKKEISLL